MPTSAYMLDCGVKSSKVTWLIGAGALSLGLFLAVNWQGVLLALAMTSNETRPRLLDDAEWNKPQTAVEFNKRFAAGSRQSDLLTWLQANGFEIDLGNRAASRIIKALPCNEAVEVEWEANSAGALNGARATVREAGCL